VDFRPVLFLLAVLIFGALAYAHYQAEKKRRRRLKAWAMGRKLQFQSTKDKEFRRLFPAVKILHKGHSRFARNIITGALGGRELTACDYEYTTGHGKNRHTHRLSLVFVRSRIPLVPLFIRPENMFDRVGEFIGLDDIDFESAEFSRTFHVSSPDKRWAYDVIHGRMMEYLLAQPRFRIEFALDHIIVYRTRRFDVADFDAAIKLARGVDKRIPEYVVREIKGQSRDRGAGEE